jgi:hypothetical protein
LSRDLADSDPEKWVYSEHAAAKHEILRRYLGAWLPILGTAHNRLVIYDGFAGRGRYTGDEPGSPVLIFRRAVEAVDAGRPHEVSIRCVEADRENHTHLHQTISELTHPAVTIQTRHERFDVVANEAADHAAHVRQMRGQIPPIFFFADPFGFTGVRLNTISRDMRRFLEQPNLEAPLTEFFGGDAWRACADAADRESCLVLRFSKTVRERGVARFATPFRVMEDERRQTIYYLVHLTNEPLGMREMKKAMIKTSPEMTFWPVTVRPPDQLALDTAEQAPFPELQRHLVATYGGQRMSFGELLNKDYPEGLWLEPAYRTAIKDMASREGGGATITRNRGQTRTGRQPTGLELDDVVEFDLQLLAG